MRILYCDVDTLRADHTEPYGYSRRLTPTFRSLSERGVVFENYYTSDSPCAPSRAAWSTQQFGLTNGAIGNAGPAAQIRLPRGRTPIRGSQWPPDAELLGGVLYRNGLHTASFSCFPERHQAYWFTGNFREWHMPTLSLGDDEQGQDVADAGIAWLRQNGQTDDWFLHLHFWDPHIPYVMPEKWSRVAHEAGEAPAWPDEEAIAGHQSVYGPHTARDLYEDDGRWSLPAASPLAPAVMPHQIASRGDFVKLIDGYDGAIAYWDDQLGRVIGALGELGILEDTVIIVTSDHGEAFGENGVYADHPLVNEAIHRIPLMIVWPGVTDQVIPRRRAGGWFYNIDLGPTLCEMLGIAIPAQWQGKSFAPALRGEECEGYPYLVLSHGAYTYQRAIRTPSHLYIMTLHPGCFRLDVEQLYDMDSDPHMTTNLAERECVDEYRAMLAEWWLTYAGSPSSPPDPMQTRLHEGPSEAFSLDHYADRLRQTGREELAVELLTRRRGL